MSSNNIVAILTQLSVDSAFEFVQSRFSYLVVNADKIVVLVDHKDCNIHITKGNITLISISRLRLQIKQIGPLYSNMNEGVLGFNISLQRTVCSQMTANGKCVIMIDDDIKIDNDTLNKMFYTCRENSALGVRILGSDSRDSITHAFNSENSSKHLSWKGVVSGGCMALGPYTHRCFFPPGYNETWLWCLIASRSYKTHITRLSDSVIHQQNREAELPVLTHLIGEQLGVLLYQILWRLRSDLTEADSTASVLLSKQTSDLIDKLSPSIRIANMLKYMNQKKLPMIEKQTCLLQQLSFVNWHLRIYDWAVEFKKAENAWKLESMSVRNLLEEILN